MGHESPINRNLHDSYKDREPVLFVALENSDGLISLDLNNGDITVIVDGLGNPAIDYHTRLGLLYYTDLNTRALSRIRYPPNGNTASPEIIIQAEDDHRPSAVAVDSINNLIYWADDYADSITKADLCGLNQNVILQDSSIHNILGIALDVENSVIYFSDNGAGKIEKIGLDGSNRQTLYSNADYPNLIYLDIKEQKLYWTNTGSQNIQSMTSDGKDVKTVISYSHYPYGIDGYNGYIYWSQSRNGIIKRADKSGGSTSSWYHTRPYGVVGVKVYGL
ncbi:LRP5_6 [Mytilus edulis]|uniref:LRP5_6 n=1 Tax=Mytilus edulis TaxID=6550 RepID=A0A8S3R9X7_MYTED|nr:LRP5_6 [Mytilus edulis]